MRDCLVISSSHTIWYRYCTIYLSKKTNICSTYECSVHHTIRASDVNAVISSLLSTSFHSRIIFIRTLYELFEFLISKWIELQMIKGFRITASYDALMWAETESGIQRCFHKMYVKTASRRLCLRPVCISIQFTFHSTRNAAFNGMTNLHRYRYFSSVSDFFLFLLTTSFDARNSCSICTRKYSVSFFWCGSFCSPSSAHRYLWGRFKM